MSDNGSTLLVSPERALTIVTALGVPYVLGWFYERAYLEVFHASWLIDSIPSTTIVNRSIGPAIIFLVALQARMWLGRSPAAERFELATAVAGVLVIIVIPLMSSMTSLISAATAYVAAAVGAIVWAVLGIHYGYKLLTVRRTQTSTTVPAALSIATFVLSFGLYQVPTSLGSSRGRLDHSRCETGLPTLRLRDERIPRRVALLITDNDVFAITLPLKTDDGECPIVTGKPSPIEVFPRSEVAEFIPGPDS